jgi:hypothetical protein
MVLSLVIMHCYRTTVRYRFLNSLALSCIGDSAAEHRRIVVPTPRERKLSTLQRGITGHQSYRCYSKDRLYKN